MQETQIQSLHQEDAEEGKWKNLSFIFIDFAKAFHSVL